MIRAARIAVVLGLAALAPSCSTKADPEELPDPDVVAADTNPDGIPYPTDNQGGNQRANGRPGDRIPNFAFRGYRNGDRSKGLETISLADYYDPEQKRHKVLHLQVAATWCGICAAEISATIERKEELVGRGIALLEVIVSGQTGGFGPSLGEVEGWMSQHRSNIDTAIDVRARRLGGIGIDPNAVPYDLLIDTRTMEILDSSVGAPLDVGAYGREGVEWVKRNPPSY